MLYFGQEANLSTFILGVKDAPNYAIATSIFIGIITDEYGPEAADDVLSRGFTRRMVPFNIDISADFTTQVSEQIEGRLKNFHLGSCTEFVWVGGDDYIFWGVTRFPRIKGVASPVPEVI